MWAIEFLPLLRCSNLLSERESDSQVRINKPRSFLSSLESSDLGKPMYCDSISEIDCRSDDTSLTGVLIVNADDWGRDRETTARTMECVFCGAVSSVSAMVYMEDSERAATIARERGIDAGLHLNFTTRFSASNCSSQILEHQRKVSAFLLRHSFAQAVYNPLLAQSFEHVVKSQLEEFRRLYGEEVSRIDGHHHMHLSANVLLGKLLPAGTIVRRNFSFGAGEKNLVNRSYRKLVDRKLSKTHHLVDFFFSLPPLEPVSRLEIIFLLARRFAVEVETHPINSQEYSFLTRGEILRIGNLQIAPRYIVTPRAQQS